MVIYVMFKLLYKSFPEPDIFPEKYRPVFEQSLLKVQKSGYLPYLKS